MIWQKMNEHELCVFMWINFRNNIESNMPNNGYISYHLYEKF